MLLSSSHCGAAAELAEVEVDVVVVDLFSSVLLLTLLLLLVGCMLQSPVGELPVLKTDLVFLESLTKLLTGNIQCPLLAVFI